MPVPTLTPRDRLAWVLLGLLLIAGPAALLFQRLEPRACGGALLILLLGLAWTAGLGSFLVDPVSGGWNLNRFHAVATGGLALILLSRHLPPWAWLAAATLTAFGAGYHHFRRIQAGEGPRYLDLLWEQGFLLVLLSSALAAPTPYNENLILSLCWAALSWAVLRQSDEGVKIISLALLYGLVPQIDWIPACLFCLASLAQNQPRTAPSPHLDLAGFVSPRHPFLGALLLFLAATCSFQKPAAALLLVALVLPNTLRLVILTILLFGAFSNPLAFPGTNPLAAWPLSLFFLSLPGHYPWWDRLLAALLFFSPPFAVFAFAAFAPFQKLRCTRTRSLFWLATACATAWLFGNQSFFIQK